MAASVRIGTASWADKPLIESGKFYPPEVKSPEARLRYYASQFPLVELDSSYYGIPTEETAALWVKRTPDGFTFDVKAYALFTEHPAPVTRLPKAAKELLSRDAKRNLYRKDAPPELIDYCWAAFIDALAPLHKAGKLGVIVLQFPKWVFPNRETKDYLAEVRDRLGEYRGAVEFRNNIWLNAENREDTLALLGDLGFTYICVDEPQGFSSSVPPLAAATSDLAFVRFHGRNEATWEKRTRTSAERFDYRYRPEELREWVPKIRELAEGTAEVHAVMNTNNEDQGPANARLLAEVLTEAGVRVAG